MTRITTTDAKNKFGQVLDLAQAEPVHVQKHGRDIAVIVSAAEYQRLLSASAAPKVGPRVQQLLMQSMARRKSVYEALAR